MKKTVVFTLVFVSMGYLFRNYIMYSSLERKIIDQYVGGYYRYYFRPANFEYRDTIESNNIMEYNCTAFTANRGVDYFFEIIEKSNGEYEIKCTGSH